MASHDTINMLHEQARIEDLARTAASGVANVIPAQDLLAARLAMSDEEVAALKAAYANKDKEQEEADISLIPLVQGNPIYKTFLDGLKFLENYETSSVEVGEYNVAETELGVGVICNIDVNIKDDENETLEIDFFHNGIRVPTMPGYKRLVPYDRVDTDAVLTYFYDSAVNADMVSERENDDEAAPPEPAAVTETVEANDTRSQSVVRPGSAAKVLLALVLTGMSVDGIRRIIVNTHTQPVSAPIVFQQKDDPSMTLKKVVDEAVQLSADPKALGAGEVVLAVFMGLGLWKPHHSNTHDLAPRSP